MKIVRLSNIDIPYKIAKKNNKNTYFYFKRDGYIQINLSKYQSEKEMIRYMHNHADHFAHKFQKTTQKKNQNATYKLWGLPYQERIDSTANETILDIPSRTLIKPMNEIDHDKYLRKIERSIIENVVLQLVEKYRDNGLVDITGVRYSYRYMTSRHGSCNKARRRISLNTHLIHYDMKYLEYVFLHEISHLNHAHHGPEFYELLNVLCPNYKELRKALKEIW